MGLVDRVKELIRPNEWSELSEQKKLQVVARAHLFEGIWRYASFAAIPRVYRNELFVSVVPETIGRNELEEVLEATTESYGEIDELSYCVKLHDALLQDHSPFEELAFYQQLNENSDKIQNILNQKKMSVVGYSILLGAHLLDQAERQGLIIPTKTGGFTRSYGN